jgi:glycosyltransferase involved in cell wall biosynthesis
MDKLFIVMPVYNEEESIEAIAKEWNSVVDSFGNGGQLIIFNDGSTDGTSKILDRIKNKYRNMIVIDKENTGHGPTCVAAYQFAVEKGADWVFQTDSDGQTKSDEFWGFWEKRNDYDFIIGYRAKRRDGLARIFISNVLKKTLLFIFGVSVKDANAPFRLMKVNRLRLYLPAIPDNYFIPNVLLSMMAVRNKEKIFWQEISFMPRRSGRTSIPLARFGGLGIKLIKELYKMKNPKLPQ